MITVAQAAKKLKVSERRVRVLCAEDRVPGATKVGRDWLLPDKPVVTPAERRRPGVIRMRTPRA